MIIFAIVCIQAHLILQIYRDTHILRETYEKSQKIVGTISKLINRYEEIKFLNPTLDLSSFESFIYAQLSNINFLFIGQTPIEKNIKKLNNETLINSLKF